MAPSLWRQVNRSDEIPMRSIRHCGSGCTGLQLETVLGPVQRLVHVRAVNA
ncbi:hypothetical protein ACFVQ0_26275 [Streptomyces sp. NPDC057900]|uniref:hypothetical protein n=1 Tax=Streptomyces sp. NPDC057900 TaxID=3346274 RepID=UPI0036EE254B